MIYKRSGEQATVLYDASRRTSRRCGDCQLCCKLIPVEEFGKPANCRCEHQRTGKGCSIYRDRPLSCALWNCRWLVEKECADLPRPDRAHYVLDVMPDYVTLTEDGGAPQQIPVIQVWCDPAFPDAHKAPSFRDWLDRQATCALIRYGSSGGLLLAPPSVTNGLGWQEKQSNCGASPPHRLEDVARVMGGETANKFVLDIVADFARIER